MAYSQSINQSPLTGALAMWQFISTIIAAGGTQVDSSDGTTRGAAQVTGGGTGTNGLNNASAWVRFKLPNGSSGPGEYVVQRTTSANSTDWRIKWSPAAYFSGGSPSNVRVPSATDEVLIYGSGTDAAPGFLTLFGTDNAYYANCRCDSTTGKAWFTCHTKTTGGTPSAAWVIEPTTAPPSVTDASLWITYLANANALLIGPSTGRLVGAGSAGSTSGATWGTNGTASTAPVAIFSPCASYPTISAGIPVDGRNSSKDALMPLAPFFFNNTGTGFVKGSASANLAVACITQGRTNPILFNYTGTSSHVLMGHMLLEWDGSSTLTI